MELKDAKIAMIGLGYVGLPLAVAMAEKYPVVGFDISAARVAELRSGQDSSLEVSPEELASSTLNYTSELDDIADCNVYIVTVPTPIDESKTPDLRPLQSASNALGSVIRKGDVIIFESTVYPGATEEYCIPIMEKISGLTYNQDFFAGYSPERINPGDKQHTVKQILKVTSGSTPEIATFVDDLYGSVITAGTFKASSIRVAEAAKVIENTQRDVNIALINELALIFDRLDIDTEEVLQAAGTKWNFLPFRPGLVGGHCIGVDPYYLTYKAQSIGYHPAIVLAGRRINDNMGHYVVSSIIKLMLQRDLTVNGARALILGLTFKENCPDLRNTRVVDIIAELESYGMKVDVYDPWIDPQEAEEEYGIRPIAEPEKGVYNATVLAVAHRQFEELGSARIREFGTDNSVLFDVKYLFPKEDTDGRL